MSRFSGKCDFCDLIDIFGLDKILNSIIYVGDKRVELKSRRDCIPYYPHIERMGGWDAKEGRGVFFLTDRSWVDIEEERYGHMKIHDYYREALRKEMEAAEHG